MLLTGALLRMYRCSFGLSCAEWYQRDFLLRCPPYLTYLQHCSEVAEAVGEREEFLGPVPTFTSITGFAKKFCKPVELASLDFVMGLSLWVPVIGGAQGG